MGAPSISAAYILQNVNAWAQQQRFADGAVGTPSLAFNAASGYNYGIYYSGSAIRVAVAGTERFLVASACRFGGTAAATGYGNIGDIVLPATGGARAKNTAKSWGCISISGGVPTLLDGFNVSSLTDTGTGRITVNKTTASTDTNYAVVTGIKHITTTNGETCTCPTKATGSFELNTLEYSGGLKDLNGGQVNFILAGL